MIYIKGKGYETENFLTWGEVEREIVGWECLTRAHRGKDIRTMAYEWWVEQRANSFYNEDFDMWFSDNIQEILTESGWKYEEK